MHKLLRLENISSLPLSLRPLAKLAANGSLEHLQQLLAILTQKKRDGRYTHCLPVFYANLDPAEIPTGEDLDASTAVTRASVALKALQIMNADEAQASGPDLWPRIFAWISALHAYRGPVSSLTLGVNVCFDLLSFLQCFSNHPRTMELIEQTVGVRALVVHAWAALFESEKGADHPGFAYLCNFIHESVQVDDPTNLAEILEAAGGPAALGSLVVKYIQLFVPSRQTHVTERLLFFLDGIIAFLGNMQYSEAGREISGALVSAGVVTALTSATCAVSGSTLTHEDIPESLLDAFEVLEGLLTVSPSHRTISDALAAGLLPAIVHSSILCSTSDDIKRTSLWNMVKNTLPASTVYYTVIVQLEAHILGAEAIVQTSGFNESPMFKIWDSFMVIAHGRIQLMKDLYSGQNLTSKACDNMECGVIRPKVDFRRCSHCQRAYYCSEGCQKLDWKDGNHRQACQSIRYFRLTTPDVSQRNLSFMREIFHRDMQRFKYKENLLPLRLSNMRKRPSEPLITVLDYTRGGAELYVSRLAYERGQDIKGEVNWDEHIGRANRSGGRMELHLMVVLDGKIKRRRMFPQRSSSSGLTDGLIRISKEVPEGSEATREIQALLEANADIVDIHTQTRTAFIYTVALKEL
ncbi:hypothetical protein C8R44DRAFT_992500 [Mycena epipterygia]|nr:hypothetical protein C8R44DRAFT_992500 [Mycena epipterygia]